MRKESSPAAQEWRIYWPLAMAVFVGSFFSAMPFQAFGLMMDPVRAEFGWNVTQVTTGLTLHSILMVPMAPVVGALVDKFGGRRVALPGLIVTMIAATSISLATNSTVLWLALWTFLGIVIAFPNMTVWTSAIVATFKHGQGLALAFALSGMSAAAMVLPPLTQWLTDSFGWRIAFASLSIGLGVLAFVSCYFFLHIPSAVRRELKDGQPDMLPGLSVREALTSIPLLRIALATLIIMTVGAAVFVHRVPMLTETGFSREQAAQLAALFGLTTIIGKFSMGWAMQKWNPSSIGALALGTMGIAFCAMLDTPFRSSSVIVIAVSVLGFTGGAKMQVAAMLTSIYAGPRNFGKIYGFILSFFTLGAGVGVTLGGMAYDASQSYQLFYLLAAPSCFVGAALLFRLGDYPEWARFGATPAVSHA